MSEIKGGISTEEYCAIVNQLIHDNWQEWDNHQKEAAFNAWNEHCR